ncbi:hypothetical protein VOLCADRAFT_92533 [Volvox carteri f. nagariensis]|uniref:Uncharacterized protein n=1 Tax=Volvox carteri f. nagariensis TaxID=3068 RepID=D8TZX0_VOLCA|nr:uncharacterized protein VOLCADRAFT_92533 [Volvox carteri f. nagariensis]EFJ47086.1 hypothetical protein VOLCADRAFT_92533 [Volvox carteri f. nagariensis]|eukprot:XP_002951981.1 hypothetical protein VOLCADRAFT_92533 [Volvox carteri f. nagariensis]
MQLYGVATAGDPALLFSRLVIARGHILAAVFEGHISPSAAEYCRSHCWEAFVQATASRQQTPAAATSRPVPSSCVLAAFSFSCGFTLHPPHGALRALDRGFLTCSKHSLESRLSSGCSATLLHIDLATRTVTTASVGAHGAVGLGSSTSTSSGGVPGVGRSTDGGGGGAAVTVAADAPAATASAGRRGALGFGCAKDLPVLVAAYENAANAAAAAAAATAAAAAAHVHAQPAGRFGAASRHLHCGCEVRVSSRPLAAGDECLVLLAGCGGAGGRTASGGLGARAGGRGSSGAGGVVAAAAAASMNSGAGGESNGGGNASAARSGGAVASGATGSGAISSGGASGGLIGSSALLPLPLPCAWAPAGALSAADAVSLAHELAAAAAAWPPAVKEGGRGASNVGGATAANSAASVAAVRLWGPAMDDRFGVLYDSYDAEATAVATATPTPTAVNDSSVGDRSAMAVASYAVTAALRNRGGLGGLVRGMGASAPPATPASLSAACITIWLDWGIAAPEGAAAAGGAVARPATSRIEMRPPPPPQQLPRAAARWDLLRAYCRFVVARRRRIIAMWHALAAAVAAAAPQRPSPSAAAPSPLAQQIASVLSLGAGGAGQASFESCTGGGTATVMNRTASFTSRPPVMMEFVEELPTPASSGAVVGRHDPYGGSVMAAASAVTATAAASASAAIGSSMATAAANAAAATLDESHTHSASAAAPYGISGLVMAPMGSTEDMDVADGDGDAGGFSVEASTAQPPPPPPLLSQRSFVMPYPLGNRSVMAALSLRPSQSMSDLNNLEAKARAQSINPREPSVSRHGSDGGAAAAVAAATTNESTSCTDLAAPHEAEAHLPYHRYYSNQMSTSSAASTAGFGAGAGGGGGGGASGSHFDWSLVMTSVQQSSDSRYENSAGHTPIPSTAANRFASSLGYGHDGVAAAAASHQMTFGGGGAVAGGRSPAGESHAVVGSGGYLAIPGGGGGGGANTRLRQKSSAPPPGSVSFSSYVSRDALSAASVAAVAPPPSVRTSSRSDSVGSGGPSVGRVGVGSLLLPSSSGCSLDVQPTPGIVIGRRSAGDSDGDDSTSPAAAASAGDAETETELISEDLPQLRIESTAELAALMAEIIITDDGEVVRGAGGAAMPPPYNSRSHGLHVGGLHSHKGSRSLSRQGSRGWQPRLAIVREDAREANTSTSCSQLLLAEGVRFTAISEERGSSTSQRGRQRRPLALQELHAPLLEQQRGRQQQRPCDADWLRTTPSATTVIDAGVTAFTTVAATDVGVGVDGEGASSRNPLPLRQEQERVAVTAAAAAAAASSADVATRTTTKLPLSAAAAPPPPLPSELPSTGLADVLDDLRPSLESHGLTEKDAAAAPSRTDVAAGAVASLLRITTSPSVARYRDVQYTREPAVPVAAAAVAAAAVERISTPTSVLGPHWSINELATGDGFGEDVDCAVRDTGAAAVAGGGWQRQSPYQLRSYRTAAAATRSDATAAAAAAAAAALSALESFHEAASAGGYPDDADAAAAFQSATFQMVGRARSASVSRSAGLSNHRNHHQSSFPFQSLHHVQHRQRQHSACQYTSVDAASADGDGDDDGGDDVPVSCQTTAPQLPVLGPPSGDEHHSIPSHPAAARRTRRLYGLSEAVPPLSAGSAARSCCSAAAATASATTAAAAAYDTSGAAANTVTTIDRSWSMGSGSGPLYSLLQSTLSKGSITAATTSTAIPTPACDSAQCSGTRLPIVRPLSPPPLSPLQASSAAAPLSSPQSPASAGAAASSTAGPSRVGVPCTQPESGGGGGGGHSRRPSLLLAADTDADAVVVSSSAAAVAGLLPSLPADCASSSRLEGSASFSVTLHAPRFSDWEPQGAGAAAIASGVSVGIGVNSSGSVATVTASPVPGFGFRIDIPPATAAAAGGGGTQSAALMRTFGGVMYGTYGAIAGPSNNAIGEAASAYDDGAVTNRSSNISRSDASVWNSTSAWTTSTGRTTDTMMSNRRVLASNGGVGGGSSCLMLPPGIAVGGGGYGLGAVGGGGGDTSGLLAYNAAYSSISGLVMTADAGAPGSNTQLLVQMAAPGTFCFGNGGGAANGQNSSQLFPSSRQLGMFPAPNGGGGAGGGGESFAYTAGQTTAAMCAQVTHTQLITNSTIINTSTSRALLETRGAQWNDPELIGGAASDEAAVVLYS